MTHFPVSEIISPNGKAVVVTGCSSGIGRATAIYLAQFGFTVFATVRKEADAQNLRNLNIPTLIPICPLDLSDPHDITMAVESIEAELDDRAGLELYAIVNNAGGGSISPIELMDVNQFRTELAARILGPIELLQAFLPHIRQAHGRVLWIATPALLPIPFVANIHACDFAINCLARTLQLELKPWNIPSIQIRCGGVMTAAPDRNMRELEAAFKQWPRERLQLYVDTLHKTQAEFAKFDTRRTQPEVIAKVVYKALTVSKPKRRYQIGHRSGVAMGLEYLPQPLVDSILESRT